MAGDELTIVVVCTANQCRSPLTAAVLQARLAARMVPAAVVSVGTDAVGAPATPPTVDAANRLGLDLDLSEHTSRPLDAAALANADLVIAMERRHVQEAVVKATTSFAHTFTLKELVRRGSEIGPRGADETLDGWLARVHLGRKPMDLLGSSRDDDIADPTVSAIVDHDAMAREVLDLVDRLVALAWP
jgi:protein-tyrosine-phosphatase